MAGLVPSNKSVRVANFHRLTVASLCEMIAAAGVASPAELRPWHIMHRISPTETKHYGELYEYLKNGALLHEPLPESYRRACNAASADSFSHV